MTQRLFLSALLVVSYCVCYKTHKSVEFSVVSYCFSLNWSDRNEEFSNLSDIISQLKHYLLLAMFQHIYNIRWLCLSSNSLH